MIRAEFERLYQYRDLLRTLVTRALKVRYRRSAIGFLWTILHPLMTMLVLSAVFSEVFRTQVPHYGLHALAGIVFWQFFSQTVTSCLYSLKGHASLLTKLPLPTSIFPLSTVLSGLTNLAFALVPLLLIAAASGARPDTAVVLYLPLSVLLSGLFTLGLGLLLAPLAVMFSDTIEVVSILLTLLMYLTPVFYPSQIVPARLQWLMTLNPLAAMLDLFRGPLLGTALPSGAAIVVATSATALVLTAGIVVFARTSRRLALYL